MQAFDAIVALNADIVDDLEKTRIANENRLAALTDPEWGKGIDPAMASREVARLGEIIDAVKTAERAAIRHLEAAMRAHPLGAFVGETRGLGYKTVARFIGSTGPLQDRERPSSLWAYCGLHVVDGSAPRARRGQSLNYSPVARKRAWLMAESCIKMAGGVQKRGGRLVEMRPSPYRQVYDDARAKYASATLSRDMPDYHGKGKPGRAGEPLSDGHQHNRALRLVMKAIVRDLWVEARRAAGHGAHRQGEQREAAD